jgi:drug/metabolite transporter (DMT)-like permease
MLGERIHWRRGLGIVLTFLGVILVIWEPGGMTISVGLAFVALSAVASSFGVVMMKQVETVSPLRLQAWVALASVIPAGLFSAALETGQVAAITAGGWHFLAALLFSSLVVSVVAHTAYYGLIQRYEANLIAPLILMTPILTIVFGVIFTHDRIDLQMAVGSAIALLGVLIITLRKNRAFPKIIVEREGP